MSVQRYQYVAEVRDRNSLPVPLVMCKGCGALVEGMEGIPIHNRWHDTLEAT